ncbi:D-tyrosyl-tRNA(Tyr) deacylase [bacterium]|nr:D-tyrosyl-tRNA(Tyr) deacylase [bacterium]
MKIVLQRVTSAKVVVENEVVGAIEQGLLILLGIAENDTDEHVSWAVQKVCELRIFTDSEGKFNLSLEDVGGAALVVSQFTLLGDVQKGRRPSFIKAARPDVAIPLYEKFVERLRGRGVRTETGQFGAKMDVHLVNDGPVTLIIEK